MHLHEACASQYLVKPEVPVKAVVCLTGDSESGKTTLACAWARDLFRQGHRILILDRGKNSRDRIGDRLERLGIESGGETFHVWDCEQREEAPQPDDPRITDWVKRMVAQTGKSALVIVDSLVSFLWEDEDENSAVHMRPLFNRRRRHNQTRRLGNRYPSHEPERRASWVQRPQASHRSGVFGKQLRSQWRTAAGHYHAEMREEPLRSLRNH